MYENNSRYNVNGVVRIILMSVAVKQNVKGNRQEDKDR